MIILKNVGQINEKLNNIFGVEGLFEENDYRFINDNIDENDLKEIAKKINKIDENKKIEELSDLIFQLKDYIPALCNLIKLFLYSNNYEAVYSFVNKIFVAHIGNINYSSTLASYNITERYFDRFVEIVKCCNIPHGVYLPFILDILKTNRINGLNNWKAPAVEYLQKFFNENEVWALEYLKNNVLLKYDLLEAITEFNTIRGLKLLMEDYSKGIAVDKEQTLHILKRYKKESMNLFDRMLLETSEEQAISVVNLLIEFDSDPEVLARLKEIYEKSKSDTIKEIIANKLGYSDNFKLKTEKQFLSAVRREVKEPQERSLGEAFEHLPLKYASGLELDNYSKTYLINIFKEEKLFRNIFGLKVISNYIDEQDLSNFSIKLFERLKCKDSILQAKWCIRMVTLFASDEYLIGCKDYMITLLNTKREKEVLYFLQCLIAGKRDLVIELLDTLLIDKNGILVENIEKLASMCSNFFNVDIDEILDYLSHNEESYANIDYETKRLYNNFISERKYTNETFSKIFLKPGILNTLSKKLVFGEYVNEKLYSVFVVENFAKVYKYGTRVNDENMYIAMVHSIDLDSRFKGIENLIKEPLFNQFEKVRFDIEEFNRSTLSINKFCGAFFNIESFSNELSRFGFKVNKQYDEILFSNYIHEMPRLNILTEINIEKPVTLHSNSATLGSIFFYHLEDVLKDKGKYLTKKENSISIGSLPRRYFNYVLNAVYLSLQN